MKRKQKLCLIFAALFIGLCIVVTAVFAGYYGGLHNLCAAAYSRIFGVLPVWALPEAEGIPVLMYHHLAPDGVYAGTVNEDNAAIISVEDFSIQMEYLAMNGYNTIFLSELVGMLQSDEELPEKTVAITFDDAYESVYIYAYPILQKYGFKASVAIIGETVNMPAASEYDPTMLSTLSFEQINEMQQSGIFEFQSHTYNLHQIVPVNNRGALGYAATSRIYLLEHARRESIEEKAQRLQNDFKKQDELLSSIGINASVLLYPYGETDRELIAAAKENGMQAGFTVRTGFVTKNCDIFRLPRITISQRDDYESFVRKLTVGK